MKKTFIPTNNVRRIQFHVSLKWPDTLPQTYECAIASSPNFVKLYSIVPTGLGDNIAIFPEINFWAILVCPFGTQRPGKNAIRKI